MLRLTLRNVSRRRMRQRRDRVNAESPDVTSRKLYGCTALAALALLHRRPRPRDGGRERRHQDDLAPSHPHQRRHHHHLQARRPLRRGGAEEAQLVRTRLAQGRRDRDGSAPLRPRLGGGARDRRQQGGLRGVRLSLAGHQRDAALPQQRRRRAQPAHARQGDGFLHPRRVARRAAQRRAAAAARRRRLLSDLGIALRTSRRRQCAPLGPGDQRARDGEDHERPCGPGRGSDDDKHVAAATTDKPRGATTDKRARGDWQLRLLLTKSRPPAIKLPSPRRCEPRPRMALRSRPSTASRPKPVAPRAPPQLAPPHRLPKPRHRPRPREPVCALPIAPKLQPPPRPRRP